MNFSQTLDEKGYAHITTPCEIWLKIPSLAGKWVSVTITKFKKRGSKQNRYYWGCIVPIFRQIYIDCGYDLNEDETHEELKRMFLGYDEVVDEKTGEVVLSALKQTKNLTTQEFIDYCERIKRCAAEKFDVYIADPNEQIKIT